MPLHSNKNDSAHFNSVEKKAKEVQAVLDNLVSDIVKNALLSSSGTSDGIFSFDKHPRLKRYFNSIVKQVTEKMVNVINDQTKDSWARGSKKSIDAVIPTLRNNSVLLKAVKNSSEINLNALQSFQNRKTNGMTLSDKVWNITKTFKQEMEFALDLSIAEGKSAQDISKEVRKLLKNPTKASMMIRDKHGNKTMKKLEKGVYQSSYKNAMRLARTENNIAYHTASYEKYNEFDFVVGIEVRLSNNIAHCPFCQSMAGKYPKDFKFTSWHPQCYSDDTELMTDSGWKLFEDLKENDKILSLNPETRQTEWVKYVKFIKYHRKGNMFRFHNRNTDMLVTPDHKMIYISKWNGELKDDKLAENFDKNKGILYRSSEYKAGRIENVKIGSHEIDFDLFCEFMAYYLSEGNLFWTRKNQIKISQCKVKHKEQYETIKRCLEKMPFRFSEVQGGFYFNDKDFYEYLKQFGKSESKHVPDIIKNSAQEQIKIFLDAYIICDGYTKKAKSFVGNRGGLHIPKNNERLYFTSSNKMSVDIGEMILKLGKRPSYRYSARKGDMKIHRNGTYTTNNDNIIITECNSQTATVFEKSEVEYDGFVYDIELEKNHIFYVRRNGKCVWGSNCRCTTIPILKTPEEMQEDNDAIAQGKEVSSNSVNEVKTPNKTFMDYIALNKSRIEGLKSKPYFYQDNMKYVNLKDKKVKAEKTEEQKKKIQDKWDKRKALHESWINDYQNIKSELLQFPNDFNTDHIDKLFKEYKLIDLVSETNIKKIDLAFLKQKIKGLEKSMSGAESLVKEHGFEKVLEAKNSAELKIKSFENLGFDYKIDKLEFEIKWVEDNKKYPTWNVAQEVYKKELSKTKFSKSIEESKTLLEEIKAKGKGWKAQKYKDLIKDVEDKILSANVELLDVTQIAELNKSIKKLSDYTDETVAKKLALASKPKKVKGEASVGNFDEVVDFDDLPTSVIDDLIDKFEKESLSVEEVDSLLRNETKDYWKTISEKERRVLTKYTQTYNYLNEPLRNITYYGDESKKKKEFIEDMPLLTEALSKYRLKDNMVVRRGTGDFRIGSLNKHLSDIEVGDVFNDGAFLSTSTHKTKGFHEGYEMIIVYPKGAMGVYAEPFSIYNKGNFSYYSNIWNGTEDVGIGEEQEWIGQRGSRFKVIKKSGNKIFLQVIGQLYKH